MLEKISRSRVNGFLKASGRKIVNGAGEEVLLTGWGLGNWLLCEGYMWLSGDNPDFDRPRVIEKVIRDLSGSAYANLFWKRFREQYITKDDIRKMADLGYNSVRIPFNWRVLMEDEPGEIIFKEEGFAFLDTCIDWCEEYSIYAFLDMHGAPGGQTGANIDDSADNLPRLFMDDDYWEKGLRLWEKIASRYAERSIVGGYDLLNEPIRPACEGYVNCDHLLPKLGRFYEEAAALIRKTDKLHLLSIEGHHWATSPDVFYKKFDDNMVIHFHRYNCVPDISSYTEFLELSEKLNLPLWLGETGENQNEWYAAMYPLSLSLGIGYNLWPWKKMECTNSPYSIKKPSGWETIFNYVNGGPKPDKEQIIAILDEYLENMKLSNCRENTAVIDAVLRRPPCRLPAENIKPLKTGDSSSYSVFMTKEGDSLQLSLRLQEQGRFSVYQDATLLGKFTSGEKIPLLPLSAKDESAIRITVESGQVLLHSLTFRRPFYDEKYQSGPQKIPGRVMCAYFDRGGEGLAYHDSDTLNHGSGELNPVDGSYLHSFRINDSVDTSFVKYHDEIDNSPYTPITPEKDMLYVGWTVPGEWITYTISADKEGPYGIELFYTSRYEGEISLDIDGREIICNIPSTYSADDPVDWRQWHHWNKTLLGTMNLTRGPHILTLKTGGQGNMNYGYLEFAFFGN
jgi:hypothetical protein